MLGRLPAAGEPETHVLDVRDHLFEQVGDVIVVELIDDLAAIALADHEPEMAQQPKLMRDRRTLHANAIGDLVDRRRAGVQTREDPQPAWCRERLDAFGRRARERGVVKQPVSALIFRAVRHASRIAERLLSYSIVLGCHVRREART